MKKLIVEFKKKANHNSILPHSFSPWKTASNDSMAVVLFFWKQYDPTEWRTQKTSIVLLFRSNRAFDNLSSARKKLGTAWWKYEYRILDMELWIWNCGTKPRSIYNKKQMNIKLIKESKRRLKKDKLGAIASTPLVHSVLSSKLTYNFNQ